MTLASGGGGVAIFPLVVHEPASPSIWPAITLAGSLHKSRGDNVVRVCECYRGEIVVIDVIGVDFV